jgi:hypothetical protein
VLQVDLEALANALPVEQPKRVLETLIDQAQEWLSGVWQSPEQVAGEVVAKLNQVAKRRPLYLIFDTTEVLQENTEFWHWMEKHLVGPLTTEGQIQQVFAGRVPVPWRRVEVRRIVKLHPLEPLPVKNDAKNLIQEVLQENNPDLKDGEPLEEAGELVLEFSFGHPLLSEELATYVASRWPVSSVDKFKSSFCRDMVKPFIEQHFFKDIPPPWNEIVWWASVLDWFDVTILQEYLKRVVPKLVVGQRDYFFIQGITRLRRQHTVIWREERGDRLHGVIAKIVRRCLETLEPERYRQACEAAAITLEDLAGQIPEEYIESEQYRHEAADYRRRVN